MVLIDSSVWIEGMRRNGEIEVKYAISGLTEEYQAAWCSIIKLEVLGGCRKEERAPIEFYFSVIPYYPITEKTWELAKTFSWRLRDSGHTVPMTDILIAAVAMEQDCRIYTIDKHFSQMQNVLGIRLYRPGYAGQFTTSQIMNFKAPPGKIGHILDPNRNEPLQIT
jgi:predicted nucleic acid-binding protein